VLPWTTFLEGTDGVDVLVLVCCRNSSNGCFGTCESIRADRNNDHKQRDRERNTYQPKDSHGHNLNSNADAADLSDQNVIASIR
jgi:hypothetical protein